MVIIVAATMMLLSLSLVMASTIEVPTFETTNFKSNGTRTIDYTDGTTLEVPYKNSTRTIGIEEYKQCVVDSNQMVMKSVNQGAEKIKYLQALGMEGCIIFNSGK